MLLFLELDLGGCTNLDKSNATGQFGQTLLQLLAVPIGVGVFDLTLNLSNTTSDLAAVASAFDNGGVVLGDDHTIVRA